MKFFWVGSLIGSFLSMLSFASLCERYFDVGISGLGADILQNYQMLVYPFADNLLKGITAYFDIQVPTTLVDLWVVSSIGAASFFRATQIHKMFWYERVQMFFVSLVAAFTLWGIVIIYISLSTLSDAFYQYRLSRHIRTLSDEEIKKQINTSAVQDSYEAYKLWGVQGVRDYNERKLSSMLNLPLSIIAGVLGTLFILATAQ